MSETLRWSLYVCVFALTVSGVLYAVPRYADLYLELDWPAVVSPGLLMQAHGAFSFWALLLLGVVWQAHVRSRLRRPANRRTGLALCAAMAVLVVSGYLLYYIGSRELREASGLAHTACGLGLLAIMVLHVRRGASIRPRGRRPTGDP